MSIQIRIELAEERIRLEEDTIKAAKARDKDHNAEIECRWARGGPRHRPICPPYGCYHHYRLKPKPSYRSYTSEEMFKHIGETVVHEEHGRVLLVAVSISCAVLQLTGGNTLWVSFAVMLDKCRVGDGRPCGVLVSQ